jgi:hypothetical protein
MECSHYSLVELHLRETVAVAFTEAEKVAAILADLTDTGAA